MHQVEQKYPLEKADKCIIWSILVHLHPLAGSGNAPLKRVSNFRQFFNEKSLDGIGFSNRIKVSDVY